jgi:uncharacterized protein (DUF2164 family)
MKARAKNSITIPDDARKKAVDSIRRYFATELDHEIGDLKAALVLDYLLAEIAPVVYNTAIADAKNFFEERSADLGALYHHEEFAYWPEPSKRKV